MERPKDCEGDQNAGMDDSGGRGLLDDVRVQAVCGRG